MERGIENATVEQRGRIRFQIADEHSRGGIVGAHVPDGGKAAFGLSFIGCGTLSTQEG